MDKTYMTEEEILSLSLDDFRELTSEEEKNDSFRRLFQIMGLIYQNQIEIKEQLAKVAMATL